MGRAGRWGVAQREEKWKVRMNGRGVKERYGVNGLLEWIGRIVG